MDPVLAAAAATSQALRAVAVAPKTLPVDYALLAVAGALALASIGGAAVLRRYRRHEAVRVRQYELTMVAMAGAVANPLFSMFFFYGVGRPSNDPTAWTNNCAWQAFFTWTLVGLIHSSMAARYERLRLIFVVKSPRAVSRSWRTFWTWQMVYTMCAVGSSNPWVIGWNPLNRRCEHQHAPGTGDPFVAYATVLFLIPILVHAFYVFTLRRVQDDYRERKATLVFSLLVVCYIVSVYAAFGVPGGVVARVLHHSFEIAMNNAAYWLFAGPALLELYRDKGRAEHVARARARELEKRPAKTRAPSESTTHTSHDPLIVLAEVDVTADMIANRDLPALSQVRPYQHGLVRHFVDLGLMLPAMSELLCTPAGTRAFEDFLTKECSDENVKFLRACNAFVKLAEPSIARLCEKAGGDLRETFFTAGMPLEVNVTGAVSEQVGQVVNDKRASITMFDDGRMQILRLLSSDPFSRFVQTPEFEACLEAMAADTSGNTFDRAVQTQGGLESAALTVQPWLAAERFRMKQARQLDVETNLSLVIVGTGGSGKSTLVKQFRILFGDTYNNTERRAWSSRIRSNMLADQLACLRRLQARVGSEGARPVSQESIDQLVAAPLGGVGEQVAALQAAHALDCGCDPRDADPSLFSPQAAYFAAHVDRIASVDYLATDQDILYCPSSTLGVTTYDFDDTDGTHFHVIDCGGQRSQRRKWLQFFSDVTALLFVASLDDFWHALSEDSERNALRESVDTFAETVNSATLQDRCVCLFLNKTDLLPASLKRWPFRRYFPSFPADKDAENPDHVIAFVRALFEACNKSTRRARKIFVTVTSVGSLTEDANDDLAATIKRAVLNDVATRGGL